jgi:NTE family protein
MHRELFQTCRAFIILFAFLFLFVGCSTISKSKTIDDDPCRQCGDVKGKKSLFAKTGMPEARLALSGGGYRAMLYHVGALRRLNEMKVLSRLEIVSSVSGGSIVAGVLAKNWEYLLFDEDGRAQCFKQCVEDPLKELAQKTLYKPSIMSTILDLFGLSHAASDLDAMLARNLFGNTKLSDIPQSPKFLFNATNLQSGEIWTFTSDSMGDDAVAYFHGKTDLPLSTVVAASCAFPPFLSPLEIDLRKYAVDSAKWGYPETSGDHVGHYDYYAPRLDKWGKITQYREKVRLSDGGVLDNLGVEKIIAGWAGKDIFISNGGSGIRPEVSPSPALIPQTFRVIDFMHGRPTRLHSKILIDTFKKCGEIACQKPDGAYWCIRTVLHDDKYGFPAYTNNKDIMNDIDSLASLPTQISPFKNKDAQLPDKDTIYQVINWGYVSADRALPYVSSLWGEEGCGSEITWKHKCKEPPYACYGFGKKTKFKKNLCTGEDIKIEDCEWDPKAGSYIYIKKSKGIL